MSYYIKPHADKLKVASGTLHQKPEGSTPVQPVQEPVGQLCEETFGRGQVLWVKKPADGTQLYASLKAQPVQPDYVAREMIAAIAKKRTRLIGGVELVAPEVVAPALGKTYFTEAGDGGCMQYRWDAALWDKDVLRNAKMFLTAEDCQAMADAQREQRLVGGV